MDFCANLMPIDVCMYYEFRVHILSCSLICSHRDTYESVMVLNLITNLTLQIEATAATTTTTTTTVKDNNKEINIKSQYNNNTSYSNNNQIVVSH